MKILSLFILLFCNLTLSAYSNAVYLEPNEVYFLDVPQPKYEIVEEANKIQDTDLWYDDKSLEMYSEDDFAQNEFEKKLCRFINNRVKNKKLNLFSAPLGTTNNRESL